MNNKLLILLPYVLGVYFDRDLSFVFTLSGKDKQRLCNAGDHEEKFYVLIRGSFCLLYKAHVRS